MKHWFKISKSFKTRPLVVETKIKTGVRGKKNSQNNMKEEKTTRGSLFCFLVHKEQIHKFFFRYHITAFTRFKLID